MNRCGIKSRETFERIFLFLSGIYSSIIRFYTNRLLTNNSSDRNNEKQSYMIRSTLVHPTASYLPLHPILSNNNFDDSIDWINTTKSTTEKIRHRKSIYNNSTTKSNIVSINSYWIFNTSVCLFSTQFYTLRTLV